MKNVSVWHNNNFNQFRVWNQKQAIELCSQIENLCVSNNIGAHVALTGGLLYKQGYRKDLDILFYRIRQVQSINMDRLWNVLEDIGVVQISGYGWLYKAQYNTKNIDCFFPEKQSYDELKYGKQQ